MSRSLRIAALAVAVIAAVAAAGCNTGDRATPGPPSRSTLEVMEPADACRIIAEQLAACAGVLGAKARPVFESRGKTPEQVAAAVAALEADARVPAAERCSTPERAAGFVKGLLPCVGTCDQMAACLSPVMEPRPTATTP